jgi:hypothetical protein
MVWYGKYDNYTEEDWAPIRNNTIKRSADYEAVPELVAIFNDNADMRAIKSIEGLDMTKQISINFRINGSKDVIHAIIRCLGSEKNKKIRGHYIDEITLNSKYYKIFTKKSENPPSVNLRLEGFGLIKVSENSKQKCDGKILYSVEVKEKDYNEFWRPCCEKAEKIVFYTKEGFVFNTYCAPGDGVHEPSGPKIEFCPFCGVQLCGQVIL